MPSRREDRRFAQYSRPSIDRYSTKSAYRNQSRDRRRDPEFERSQETDSNRRDSGEYRDLYTRDPRRSQNSPVYKGDTHAPQNLHIDTNVVDEPRRPSLPNSPAHTFSTARPTPTEPAADRIINRLIPTEPAVDRMPRPNRLPLTGSPKIRDDEETQNLFTAIYEWKEIEQKTIPLKLQQNKFDQERRRRELELSKTAHKEVDFPPFSELLGRFKESNQESDNVDAQLYERHHESVKGLVKILNIARDSVKSWAAAEESTSGSALEAKFAELQKQIAEKETRMSAQIQELLDDQKKSTESFNTLSRDHESLKSDFVNLRSDHNNLKSEHDKLQANHEELTSGHKVLHTKHDVLQVDYEILRRDYNNLQSNHGTLWSEHYKLESEHKETQSKCETLQTTCNDLLSKCSEVKLQVASLESPKESSKESSKDSGPLADKVDSLATRIGQTEGKIDKFIVKVEDLDMDLYNEILESWIDHDIKNKVIVNERSVASAHQSIQSLQELVATGFNASNNIISGLQNDPEPVTSQPVADKTGEGELAQKSYVEEELKKLIEVLQKTVADSGDACAEMVDDLGKRVESIEAKLTALSSEDPEMTTKVGLLEQDMAQQAANCNGLVKRVGFLEEQRFGPRIDKIGIGITNLEKRVPDALINGLKMELDTIKRQFDSHDIAIRTLNGQWSNIRSTDMAERVCAQLDGYRQRNEHRLEQLEKAMADFRQSFAPRMPSEGNKPASPRMSESNKKRKLHDGQSATIPPLRNNNPR